MIFGPSFLTSLIPIASSRTVENSEANFIAAPTTSPLRATIPTKATALVVSAEGSPKAGEFPDCSMGTKVPFDTCSISLDRELYQKAWDTYDPRRHKSPGEAILEYHKRLKADNGVGIRGVSITRADYSEYAAKYMNRILPDGRKVWVDNDFPAFFDISYVFIGADKIAKAMLKIADAGRVYSIGSAEYAEKLGA